MKTSIIPFQYRILPVLAATILFLTTGCIREVIPIPPPVTTPPSGTPPTSGPFSAMLADTAWTANYYTAYFYQGQGLYQFTGVANGTNGDSTYVVISFRTPFQLNVPISSYNGPLDIYYDDLLFAFDWDAGNSSGFGVSYLQITANDTASHTIAGNFYGTLSSTMPGASYSDTITVKKGAFNLTYMLQP